MMKIAVRTALFAIAASLNNVHAAQNLLPNGDFSNAQQINGWTSIPDAGSITFDATVDATGGASGSMLVTAVPDANAFGTLVRSSCMAVAPGAAYRYGGKASPASGTGVASAISFTCTYYQDEHCGSPGDVPLLGANVPLNADGSGPFQALATSSGVLDGAARSVRCTANVVASAGGTASAQAHFDDLFFESVPPAPSSVKLGGSLSGNWYDPTHSGQGLQLEFTDQENTLIAIWFVYAPDGSGQKWIFGQGNYDTSANEVTLYAELLGGGAFPPLFVPSDVQRTLWGKLTLVFTDCNHGQLVWNGFLPGYGSGSMPLSRLTSIRGAGCAQ